MEHGLAQEATSCISFASLLKHFGKTKALSNGRRLHALMVESADDRDTFFGNYLVEMYGNCGSLKDARAVFDNLTSPNVYSCNILIKSYGQNGSMVDAIRVFRGMPHRNVVSWNAMIAGFAQNGCVEDSLHLFGQMHLEGVLPNMVTFICSLNACASLSALKKGQEIHAAIVHLGHEPDIVLVTALVNMYGKCKDPCSARSVFDRISHQDVIFWTAMITAFSQNGLGKEALNLFCQMQHKGIMPNKITFISALDACGILTALEEGQEIHDAIVNIGHEGEVALANALINMYCKCRNVLEARSVFQKMSGRDVVSWTSMIAACTQNGHGKEALELFHQMHLQGINPDKITFVGALDACAILAALDKGQEIHFSILSSGWYKHDLLVDNALVNMYGKCGSMHDTRNLFCRMYELDVVSWTAMIAACAQQGRCKEAFDLFHQMQCAGVKPDKLTFTCILTACSRTGRVADGWNLFVAMRQDYGITQSEDHYVCMVDLLGRAGDLDGAENLINSTSLEVPLAWLSMLGACSFHGDVDRAERTALHCMQLDPKIATPYIILSNAHASARGWDDGGN